MTMVRVQGRRARCPPATLGTPPPPSPSRCPPGCPAGSCCSRAAELSLLRGRRGLGSTSRSGSLRASGDPGGGERRRRRRRGLNRSRAPAPAAGWGLRRPAGVAFGRFPERPSAVRPSAEPERGAPAEAYPLFDGARPETRGSLQVRTSLALRPHYRGEAMSAGPLTAPGRRRRRNREGWKTGQSRRRRSAPLMAPLPSSPNDRRLEQHNAVNSMTEISHKSYLVHQVLHSPHFHSNSVHSTSPPPRLKKKTKGLGTTEKQEQGGTRA
ncbi:CASP-like protein 4U1 [Pteropus medius]|uniref:CASP-like protein 4U1 n=1 Tax=Pteropus vampyrus TaxID=132908 RepID=UPI00196B3275|nr:CASP-like protein 4U1 [Pteropus giganteus]